jgi:hypothetical protein
LGTAANYGGAPNIYCGAHYGGAPNTLSVSPRPPFKLWPVFRAAPQALGMLSHRCCPGAGPSGHPQGPRVDESFTSLKPASARTAPSRLPGGSGCRFGPGPALAPWAFCPWRLAGARRAFHATQQGDHLLGPMEFLGPIEAAGLHWLRSPPCFVFTLLQAPEYDIQSAPRRSNRPRAWPCIIPTAPTNAY